ncbi:hypothetical protein BBOR36S_01370 [Brevibacillus borstelensis]
MFGTVQAWFVVETSSMTHDFLLQGGSLPFFGHTTERNKTGVPCIDTCNRR